MWRKKNMKKRLISISCIISLIFCVLLTGTIFVVAKTEDTEVPGVIVFEGADEYYTYGEAAKGKFIVNANITDTRDNEDDGVMEYAVDGNKADFSYYSNVSVDENNNEKIDNAWLALQTSVDGENWNVSYINEKTSNGKTIMLENFYTASDVQMAQGCYYVIIAHYTIKRGKPAKFLFWDNGDYTYESVNEEYVFYLYNSEIVNLDDENALKQNMTARIKRTSKKGYEETKNVEAKDYQYGWKLGKFSVKGYTEQISNASGLEHTFLKKQGEKITLWFELLQDIDKLDGKKNLSIAEDNDAYDQYFETEKNDLGRGALIIRYTDPDNIKHTSKVYANFLEENAVKNQAQRIQILDEGDYEVALDYRIKNNKNKIISKDEYYRIYFKFSIRNADSKVRLYDLSNNSKLKTNDFTENGFKMNQKLSRYLDVEIEHETYDTTTNTFVKDTELNKKSENGDEYTDEGFYLITAKNRYTDSQTNRIVYVGKNKFLQRCAQSGMMPDEIVQYVKTELEKREEESRLAAEAAAKRKEERAAEESAKAAETTAEETVKSTSAAETTQAASTIFESSTEEQAKSKNRNNPWNVIGILVFLVLIVLGIAGIAVLWRRHNIKKQKEAARNYDGPLMTNLSDDPNDIKNKFKHTGERKHGKDKDNK